MKTEGVHLYVYYQRAGHSTHQAAQRFHHSRLLVVEGHRGAVGRHEHLGGLQADG